MIEKAILTRIWRVEAYPTLQKAIRECLRNKRTEQHSACSRC